MAIRKYQLNEAFAYGTLAPLVSVYCPVAPPPPGAASHLQFDVYDPFQSSALLAAALDTVTMPYRLRKGFTPASLGAATGEMSAAQISHVTRVYFLISVQNSQPECSLPICGGWWVGEMVRDEVLFE